MRKSYVSSLINVLGGEVVGRTKLQKMVFLLDAIRKKSDFHFTYHHYGPFSEELSQQIDYESLVSQTITEENRRRKTDNAPYSVFRSAESGVRRFAFEDGDAEELQAKLQMMNSYSTTVLELAATIQWLKANENLMNWERELRVRKGKKTDGNRQEQAVELLEKIGLDA